MRDRQVESETSQQNQPSREVSKQSPPHGRAGPMQRAYNGHRYACVILDNFDGWSEIYASVGKNECFEHFVTYTGRRSQPDRRTHRLRVDGSGEFVNEAFKQHY